MKEFYDILDKIKDNLRANPSVNTVTFGNLTDLDLDKTTIFPLSHVFVTNAVHNGNTLDFEVNVLCADVVDINNSKADGDDFYGNDNLHDVLNTQLSTLNSLISDLKRGSLYKDKYQLNGNPTLTPFKERFSNVLAGWEASINISVKNEAKIGLCADTADSGGAGGGENGGLAPVILANPIYYITLNQPFSFFVPAINNPTSYSVFNLIEGLSFNTLTGQLTGTLTGSERLTSMSFTATNSFGSDEEIIFFSVISDDASILYPPEAVFASDFNVSDFLLNWSYRPYNGEKPSVEVYKNNAILFTINNFVAIRIQNVIGNNKFKLRFKSQDGLLFSRFSEENFIDIDSERKANGASLLPQTIEGTPIIETKKVYYLQRGVVGYQFNIADLTLNNPTSFIGDGLNLSFINQETLETVYSIESTFDSVTGIMSSTCIGDFSSASDFSSTFRAVNELGESDPYFVYFRVIDNDAYIFNPPSNLSVSNIDTDGTAYMNWDYLPYNRYITNIEIYNGDVLYKDISNRLGSLVSGTGIDANNGVNNWKVRFKNDKGEYSAYSEVTFTANESNTIV